MVLRFKIYYLDGGKKNKNKSKEYKKLSLMHSVNTFTNFEEFKKNAETIGNKNINFEEKDNKENTLIHLAIEHNDLDLINFLIEKGVDVNTKNNEGKTPLHLAIEKNKSNEIIDFLIDKADFNIKDKNGNTKLHLAIIDNDINEIKFLIENGADVNTKNNYEKTPLQLVIELKRVDIISFLIDKVDKEGKKTLLELAIQQSNISLEDLLSLELSEIQKIELLNYFKDKDGDGDLSVIKNYFIKLKEQLEKINKFTTSAKRIEEYEKENLISLYEINLDNLFTPFKEVKDTFIKIYIDNIKFYINNTKELQKKEEKEKTSVWRYLR